MKSYAFSVMTDAMADIPYSDAFKGDTLVAPKYDSQQAIYTALFADLAKASGQIEPARIGFTTGDIMYGGDMTQWRQLANSLRLRLAIPLEEVTYSEVLFLEAEAAQRGWITGDPATLYGAAITASMQQYGVAPTDIATYLAQPRVQYNAPTALTQIAYQKWVSLFMQGME